MKVVYPDLVYGAIASSGVTYATVEDWQYFDIIRQFGPSDCIKQIETTVLEVDELLSNPKTVKEIKALFGLGNLTHVEDFASLLTVSRSLHIWYCDYLKLSYRTLLGHGKTRIGTRRSTAMNSLISAPHLENQVRSLKRSLLVSRLTMLQSHTLHMSTV